MPTVRVTGFQCARCEHVWVPRNKGVRPTICPNCKSPYWDKPRQATA